MRPVLLILVFLVVVALNALHIGLPSDVGARAALVFGFLLITGFILGEILSRLAVPRITGYLLAGITCGPSLLGLVDLEVIEHLRLVDDLALTLIALTAGAEMNASRLRRRLRSVALISFLQVIVVFLLTTGALYAVAPLFRFLSGLSEAQTLSVAAVLGLIATAKSPATTVAVIVEVKAKGLMTETVLGVTVLKDILVLAGFSLLMTVVLPHFPAGAAATDGQIPSTGWVFLSVLVSLGVGGLFGLLMILYLSYAGRQNSLFVLGSAFLMLSLSDAFHLEQLLVAVAAGFVVSNFSRQGRSFLAALEKAASPVFLVFFCLAGVSLSIPVLLSLWHLTIGYVFLRGLFTWGATALGAMAAADPPKMRRLAWTGFIGQAGVSLGLATLALRTFPQVGLQVYNLVVGAIVINQLIGPILFRHALLKSGEGRRE